MVDVQRHTRGPERLERRMLLAADPIHVGVVYLETDYLESDQDVGSDSQGDRFLLSFVGGAPQTELTELRIITDKDGDGISVGDPIYDTEIGGRGKNGAHGFRVVRVESSDDREITATAEVVDGGQELVLRLENFRAGDRLEFTLDVDEVLRNAIDLDVFNDRLDVITSGQEFQDSILDATFQAPRYESAHADAIFVNDFGSPGTEFGLDLPPDEGSDVDSRPNRSAAAVASTQQTPKPIEISGTVWVDNDLDHVRQSSEPGLPGTDLALFVRNDSGRWVDTGHRSQTDSNGRYEFPKSLGLLPGEYQVVQTQPDGFFSVAAVPGAVDGSPTGRASGTDILTEIVVAQGDQSAINMDFAEAQPAEISGHVYRDDDNDGRRDPGEIGIPGVTVRLIPTNTIANQNELTGTTAADGSYSFTGLAPGSYEVIEVTQPSHLDDGLDSAGTIDGVTVGVADNPGDAIREILLTGNAQGIEYNFGETARGSISGFVYLAAPGEDCEGVHDAAGNQPIQGVIVELQTPDGNVVSRISTSADGSYQFDGVAPGRYTIVQLTPDGLLNGTSYPGRIDGIVVGNSGGGMLIDSITLSPGSTGREFNFCEIAPASISGYVYHDANDDGIRASDETGIRSTTVSLINQSGQVVATRQTDETGRYEFENVEPGQYQIVETQPTAYLDGKDTPGQINGQTVGVADQDDRIRLIDLPQGLRGVEYNFGEILPASLSGLVHIDLDQDCIRDENEDGLAGVTIVLLNAEGDEIARTQTDSDGVYLFENLRPGRYSVVQQQPQGFFDGGAKAGSAGGVVGVNRIGEIDLGPGVNAVEYDFCEEPGASLAGMVFADLDQDCERDDDESPIAGVVIILLDSGGDEVARTQTNSEGEYRFRNLRPGQYSVIEEQPDGFFDGGVSAGTAGGLVGVNRVSEINLAPGVDATEYDFCEEPGASVAGSVFVDANGDCERDDDERPLEGVTIELHDADGTTIETTVTDAEGNYRFENLRSGVYQVFEQQPDGLWHGGQTVGTGIGSVLADDLLQFQVSPGQQLHSYNFCEQEPASLSGSVWADTTRDQRRGPDEKPIASVTIKLIDDSGEVVQTTVTDSEGNYGFADLRPGVYSVCEIQPHQFFHGGQVLGSEQGTIADEDLMTNIVLLGGVDATDYGFPEIPPATISGRVFQDGAALVLPTAPDPTELRQYRDGQFTSDDTPIQGVTIQLRDANGHPVGDDAFLPGLSVDSSIVATNAEGLFVIRGIRPGTYTIYQRQPDGFIDSLDTPGTTGGLAINAADSYTDAEAQLIARLTSDPNTDPNWDALIQVTVLTGQHSSENHFSEIRFETEPFVPDTPNDYGRTQRLVAGAPIEEFEARRLIFSAATPEEVLAPTNYFFESEMSWHLSVINAGFPRGVDEIEGIVRNASARTVHRNWDEGENTDGEWRLMTLDGEVVRQSETMTLGHEDAVALVGDFDGDGDDEAAVYVAGKWFVDLNGNGVWDSGDLWILLGTEADRPVVGDWDGDGKDDIGIFGRQWERDPIRIRKDAGLPDPGNELRRKLDNRDYLVAADDIDEKRGRTLRVGSEGALRTDAVDHVFRFGEDVDTPVAGDWNGDGIDQIGIFRSGTWVLDVEGDGRRKPGEEQFEFGQPGDQPVVGDFDGDGIDEVAVVRGDEWIIDIDGDHKLTSADKRIKLTRPSEDSQPIAGDWDGDGQDEPGYYKKAG